jgi:hypothetical protein
LQRKREEIAREEKLLESLVSTEDQTTSARVGAIQDELSRLEATAADLKERLAKLAELDQLKARLQRQFDVSYREICILLEAIGIPKDSWQSFRPTFTGHIDRPIAETRARLEGALRDLQGDEVTSSAVNDPTIHSLRKSLAEEQGKLRLHFERRNRVLQLQTSRSRHRSEVSQMQRDIQRIERIQTEDLPADQEMRMGEYLRYFELLQSERAILEELYAPLEKELETRDTGEKDLSFSVQMKVDIAAWAEHGEEMLDLRRSGPYTQRGALEQEARTTLARAWYQGDTSAIRAGIEAIVNGVREGGLSSKLRSGRTPREIADWIFSVDHISLDYTLRYRGTPLRFLSPGTRGIVLLILYLAVDKFDDRPLIVDQPEENLDNASVYDVLVRYFREAKRRRQIILVTHNPNLVVNTDAEEVIVATAERRDSGLPVISYTVGPLEQVPEGAQSVRDHVCNILEGGKAAFQSRERRYELYVDSLA